MNHFILSAFSDEIDQDLSIQMSELKHHGIGYIEMRGVNGKNISDYTPTEITEVKKQLDENGFKVSALGSPMGKINILDDFEPHFEKFKNCIELAKILESKYIRIFSFFITDGKDPAIYRDEVMRRLKMMVDYAAEHNIILLHENEKDIYGDIPERCMDILNTIQSPFLRATFDPANFIQVGVEPYPAFLEMQKQIAYFHIKDAKKDSGTVTPAGGGDGKLLELLQLLKKDNFEGFLSIEPHLGNFVGFSDFEIDDKYLKSEQSGPKQFAVAVTALKKLFAQL